MATCSFVGHYDVYETSFNDKLRQTLEKVAQENNDIEFLFQYPLNNSFIKLCLASALKLKWQYPEKKISIGMIMKDKDREEYAAKIKEDTSAFPLCAVDRIITPPHFPEPTKLNDFTMVHKKIERWMIEQSTYIIRYYYLTLNDSDSKQVYDATQKSGAMVFDLTDEETIASILDCIDKLPDREKMIIRKLNDGQKYKDIASELSISASAVQQVSKKAGRDLRDMAEKRLWRIQKQEPKPIRYCYIFNLPPVTYEMLVAFNSVVDFLISNYHLTAFYVQEKDCHSAYMFALKQRRIRGGDIPVIASISYPKMSEEQLKEIELRDCPPCTKIENIIVQDIASNADEMSLIKAMIEQSHFCICGLEDTDSGNSIRNHIGKANGKIVFDINKRIAF